MTGSNDDSDSWEPEDGAGYMPTEERTNRKSVPIEDLRALVQEWREKADKESGLYGNGKYSAFHESANDLSKVLDEYE